MSTPTILWVFPQKNLCGITDYSLAVISELKKIGWNIRTAEPEKDNKTQKIIFSQSADDSLIHIQYEHSFWMDKKKNFYPSFISHAQKPVLVSLHEVYESNPLDFPYSQVKSRFKLLQILKKWKYKRTHPAFVQELKLCKGQFYAKAIQVHNEHQRAVLLQKGAQEDRIAVIPHGVIQTQASPFRSNPQFWQFGTFGFINPSVDYDTILNALAKLKIKWRYVMGGGPRLDEHQKIIDAILKKAEFLGIKDKIHVTGYLDSDAMEDFFSMVDIYIAPFVFKSSSGSLNHAIARGLPIIAPEIPLICDMNQRIRCIETYKKGDEDSLNDSMEKLIGNNDYRRLLAQSAFLYAQQFSFQKEAQKLSDLYQKLISEKA